MAYRRLVDRGRFADRSLSGLLIMVSVLLSGVFAMTWAPPLLPKEPTQQLALSLQTGGGTTVESIQREINALLQLGWTAIVLVVAAILAAAVVLGIQIMYFSKRAGKAKFVWGLVEFELLDELREAQDQIRTLERRVRAGTARVNDIFALTTTLHSIGSSPTRNEVNYFLELLVESTSRAVHPEIPSLRVSLWLFNESAGHLKIYAAHHVTTQSIKNFVLVPGQGLAGRIYKNKNWEIVYPNSASESLVERDPYSKYETKSMLGVPIWWNMSEGMIAGALCVSHDLESDEYALKPLQVLVLSYYADLASIALNFARLGSIDLWKQQTYIGAVAQVPAAEVV